MSDILVLAEHQEGKVKKTSIELVCKGIELAKSLGGTAVVLVIGGQPTPLASQFAPFGVKKVVVISSPLFEKYNTLAYTRGVAAAVSTLKPGIVLATASPLGRDLFPRLAAHLKAGLASDCIDLTIGGGRLVARKPVYSGKAMATVVFNTPIQMATARPNSFPLPDPQEGGEVEVVTISADPGPLKCILKEVVKGAYGQADLTEAEVIVSGGRAMGNSENFKILRELADVLGATVGASRAAVDSGYAPHDMQVGQTGKVVNPKLYFAFGISGAIQHLAGMRTSKVIVAVNKDPEAPIFQKADYGIVGDLFTLVPLLTQEFKKLLAD